MLKILEKVGEVNTQMKDKARWQHLCEQIATEQDPERFMSLIKELNALLDEKSARLNAKPAQEYPSKALGTPDKYRLQ